MDKKLLLEFLSLKNSHKLIEDLKVVLYQLVHNTVNNHHYRNWVKNHCIGYIHKGGVVNLKEQVLNSMRTILTEAN